MLAYVVTEGRSDVEILQKLLPNNFVRDIQFVVGSGKYSAQAIAGTILAVKLLPVALVIDAETEDELVIREHSELLHQLLRQASPGIPFKVFTAIPEIEVLFFQNQSLLENIINQKLTGIQWQNAKRHPKEFLRKVLGEEPSFIQRILEILSDDMICVLQQHPLIEELTDFLSSFAMQGTQFTA